jgi:hypothetical protein
MILETQPDQPPAAMMTKEKAFNLKLAALREQCERRQTLIRYTIVGKMELKRITKVRGVFCQIKETLLNKLKQFEALLDTLDMKMHADRTNLVTLLKYVGEGIESRERFIKG